MDMKKLKITKSKLLNSPHTKWWQYDIPDSWIVAYLDKYENNLGSDTIYLAKMLSKLGEFIVQEMPIKGHDKLAPQVIDWIYTQFIRSSRMDIEWRHQFKKMFPKYKLPPIAYIYEVELLVLGLFQAIEDNDKQRFNALTKSIGAPEVFADKLEDLIYFSELHNRNNFKKSLLNLQSLANSSEKTSNISEPSSKT
jgi:hypothetical protein